MIDYPLPLLGFCGVSGSGKTTLLSRVLPLLREQGLRVGMVKHAHDGFDIDHPGKDTQRLREAGATQMLITSRRRIAWIVESSIIRQPPSVRPPFVVGGQGAFVQVAGAIEGGDIRPQRLSGRAEADIALVTDAHPDGMAILADGAVLVHLGPDQVPRR